MSTGKRTSASGCLSAISSMSMPPSAENSSSGPLLAGSLSTAAYISRAIGTCASTSTVATRCSPIVMPRMLPAAALAAAASAASLMPPALPRLPVGTCALTTHGPILRAAVSASSGVRASAPSGVAMPAARNSGLAACSSKFKCPPPLGRCGTCRGLAAARASSGRVAQHGSEANRCPDARSSGSRRNSVANVPSGRRKRSTQRVVLGLEVGRRSALCPTHFPYFAQ